MNNEIKEILDRLERIDHKEYSCGFEFADSGSFDETCRCFEERKKMADYITNLQKTNKNHSKKLIELGDKITNLQQELNEYKFPNCKAKDIEVVRANLVDMMRKNKRLEQENEGLKVENETLRSDFKNQVEYTNKIAEENERLKETNVYCNRTDCVGRIKDSRKYDSVYQEKEDYKSRCEKASDNLKRNYWIKEHEHNDDVVNMTLNILQNGGEKND